ncbi:hypothetical protein F7725_005736 [Dissostichus mawsoni]|uniref:Uncharacterized protein n=1 Tax=Dissostichus mawsoni TaxID=36200 RepID=A0A7J5YU82_DISMA|nr:hypothetical protein F7725_005736 [Dissostichus mawsoni]
MSHKPVSSGDFSSDRLRVCCSPAEAEFQHFVTSHGTQCRKAAQQVDRWLEVTVQRSVLQVANQLRDALLEASVQAALGPVALPVTEVQDEVGERRGFQRPESGVQSAHRLQDFESLSATSPVSGVQLRQTLVLPGVEGQVPGVDPGRGELRLGAQHHVPLPQQRQHGDEQGLIPALCPKFIQRPEGGQQEDGGRRGLLVCVYLQVVQKRSSEVHFSQRHVGQAAVQEALDLRADVQRQRLSPLDLSWSQSRPHEFIPFCCLAALATCFITTPSMPFLISVGEAETKLNSSQLSAIFCSTFSSSAARPARSIS